MGRSREVALARCVKHPGAHVVANKTYGTKSGLRRQYRCTPAVGEPHWFSVVVTVARRDRARPIAAARVF